MREKQEKNTNWNLALLLITLLMLTTIILDFNKNNITGRATQSQKIEGDVNGDKVIGTEELVIIGTNFGKTTNFDERTDVKRDGRIKFFDLVVVARHFGQTN